MRTGPTQPPSHCTAAESARIGAMRTVTTRWCSTMCGTVPARRADPRRWVRPCPNHRSGCFRRSLATGPADVPFARWPGRCARLAADPDVRLRRRIAQRGRVLRGDMTPTWPSAEQAAPVRSAHERTLAPEEVAGRSDEGVDVSRRPSLSRRLVALGHHRTAANRPQEIDGGHCVALSRPKEFAGRLRGLIS